MDPRQSCRARSEGAHPRDEVGLSERYTMARDFLCLRKLIKRIGWRKPPAKRGRDGFTIDIEHVAHQLASMPRTRAMEEFLGLCAREQARLVALGVPVDLAGHEVDHLACILGERYALNDPCPDHGEAPPSRHYLSRIG
jgi:hypothetical protein